MVFLLLTSLLALGDLRAVLTHQRMVTSQFDAGSELAYTESALNFLERYALRELNCIAGNLQFCGGTSAAVNGKICNSASESDQVCVAASCQDASGHIDNTNSRCSYCLRPSPVCKDRINEADKTKLPWSKITVFFTTTDKNGNVATQNYMGVFFNYMEYVGKAPCNFSPISPAISNLGSYSSTLCPGGTLADGTPRCAASTTNTCPVMRVTVSNNPVDQLRASVTLQSTVITADPSSPILYPDRRISFRQILPP